MNPKKLVLINPVNLGRSGFSASHSSRFPPLSLGIVAALTPGDWDVEVLAEVVYSPKQMEAEEFSKTMRECLSKIYDRPVLKAKARQTLKLTGRWDTTEFACQSNQNYRTIAMAESTFPATSTPGPEV